MSDRTITLDEAMARMTELYDVAVAQSFERSRKSFVGCPAHLMQEALGFLRDKMAEERRTDLAQIRSWLVRNGETLH